MYYMGASRGCTGKLLRSENGGDDGILRNLVADRRFRKRPWSRLSLACRQSDHSFTNTTIAAFQKTFPVSVNNHRH